MRYVFILSLVIVFVACNDGEDKTASAPAGGKYPDSFNRSVDRLLNSYYALSEAFVNWDSISVVSRSDEFVKNAGPLLDPIKSDPEIYSKANLNMSKITDASLSLRMEKDLTSKRKSFDSVSQALFDLLNDIKYDQKKIYLHECTMPYNDTGRGVWLSATEERRNPYLGLHHPYYKAGMLNCGSVESTIDFTSKNK